MDSWPIISAPSMGLGTVRTYKHMYYVRFGSWIFKEKTLQQKPHLCYTDMTQSESYILEPIDSN